MAAIAIAAISSGCSTTKNTATNEGSPPQGGGVSVGPGALRLASASPEGRAPQRGGEYTNPDSKF